MKRIVLIISIIVSLHLSESSFGQEKFLLPFSKTFNHIEVSEGRISGRYSMTHFFYRTIHKEGQQLLSIEVPGAYFSGEIGLPRLPVFSQLVEMQERVGYSIEVQSLDSVVIAIDQVFPNHLLFPVQPPAQKNAKIAEPAFNDSLIFKTPSEGSEIPIVRILYEGKMRGISFGRVEFRPYRFDNLTNSLIVYYNIHFSISPDHYSEAHLNRNVPAPFSKALEMVVTDESVSLKKRVVKDEPVTMVILSDTLFKQALQPLIEWKTSKGIRIVEAYTSDPDVGKTNSSIKAYLNDLYHAPPEGIAPPVYLLIAGDVEHVPLSQTSGQITDLYYTTFDGAGDYLPEMFHGRIAVKNDTQLTNVIDKILMYEKYQFPDPSFLDNTILIAGYDANYASVHGNGQIRYAADNYFNAGNGINATVYYHPQAASSDNEILNLISEGSSLVNYTGHGEYYGWLDPAFRLGNIDTLRNIHKYSLMIGNGCSTNQFNMVSQDCFAEAVVKIKNRGAIGYIGCTNDSYWDEDFYWAVGVGPITAFPEYESSFFGYYDKLFHLGDEPVEEWSPSLGEMIFAGNMSVQQSTSNKKRYYWEIYQLMGDPSLAPWFKVPESAAIEYPESIPEGVTMVGITASPFDYVAVSVKNKLINAKHADKYGQAYIELPDSVDNDPLLLVVTGDYRQPFMDTVFRRNSRLGYFELSNYSLSGESVENDGLLSEGESFSLDLELVYSGTRTLHALTLLLECNDEFIEITDSVATIAYALPGDKLFLKDVFLLKAADSIGDLKQFTLRISRDNDYSSNPIFIIEQVHAPVLESKGIYWEDRTFGNGNMKIEPGERLIFNWLLENSGSYKVDSLILKKSILTDSLFSDFEPYWGKGIPAKKRIIYTYSATVSNFFESGAELDADFVITDGTRLVADSVFLAVQNHFEDFSTGNLSEFYWETSANGWIIDSSTYKNGPCSLRSGKISHSSSSSVSIALKSRVMDTMRFDVKVSSEEGYDMLMFIVNGIIVGQWSGSVDWQRISFPLDSGRNIVEWRYLKDANTIKGMDAAWIDNIVFPSGSFDSLDIGVLKIIHPISSKNLGAAEKVSILVANTGLNDIHGYSLFYKADTSQWIRVESEDTLSSGKQVEIELPDSFDLSEPGIYPMVISVFIEGDAFPGNDTLYSQIDHYSYPDLSIREMGIDSISSEYVDLIVEVSNEGNVKLSDWSYRYYLNDILKEQGSRSIMLMPGESVEEKIRLISREDSLLQFGQHDYLIVSMDDSVSNNNMIEGEVFWSFLAVTETAKNGIILYPNPAETNVIVKVEDRTLFPLVVEFSTLEGKVVYSELLYQESNQFDVAKVFSESGIFIIRVNTLSGLNIYSNKIIVFRKE